LDTLRLLSVSLRNLDRTFASVVAVGSFVTFVG